MRFSHAALLIVAVFILFGLAALPAQAQVMPGCGQVQYWLGDQYGAFQGWGHSSPYASGRIPTPPYFAIHPPVYYSYPVPRSYGYSPFAYPGIVATPEVLETAEPIPAEVINPHVKPSARATSESTDDKTAQSKSRMIVNPYVGDPGLQANVELARLTPATP